MKKLEVHDLDITPNPESDVIPNSTLSKLTTSSSKQRFSKDLHPKSEPFKLQYCLHRSPPSVLPTNPSAMPAPTYNPSSAAHTFSTTPSSTTATATQTSTSTPVLRLRATAPSPSNRRRIQWAEDVVDNEGLGRKRSKGWFRHKKAIIHPYYFSPQNQSQTY